MKLSSFLLEQRSRDIGNASRECELPCFRGPCELSCSASAVSRFAVDLRSSPPARERGERERAKKRQAFLRTLAIGGADEDQEAEEEEEEKRKLQEEERAQEDAKRAEDDLAAIVKPVVRDADVFTRKVDYIA